MWQVAFDLIQGWLDTLDDESVTDVFFSIEQLQFEGPTLGRPLVDTITGSKVKNMKELRPLSPKDSELRVLFACNPKRRAIMLVGGDKATGKNRKAKWSGWYRKAIPQAERLWDERLRKLEGQDKED